MRKCPFCDHPNPPDSERCENCGAWLVQGVPTPPGPTLSALETPEQVDAAPGTLDERLRLLLSQRRKVEAIKLYREQTGVGLAEAKQRVEALQREPEQPPHDFEGVVLAHLEQGEKIKAIKVYREQTGFGLKEAKDAVEALGREHNLRVREIGCGAAVTLLIVLAGTLATLLR